MLSQHLRNEIHLRVEFNIYLHLCIALYRKMKAPSCLQAELYLTWLGRGAPCCGDASSATWAAPPRLCSAQVSLCCSSEGPRCHPAHRWHCRAALCTASLPRCKQDGSLHPSFLSPHIRQGKKDLWTCLLCFCIYVHGQFWNKISFFAFY